METQSLAKRASEVKCNRAVSNQTAGLHKPFKERVCPIVTLLLARVYSITSKIY